MKPAFALSFSENGISLHHQSDGEWFCIGTVPLDAPDLPERIEALRAQGFALENHLSCTLIIPPDQVRLLQVDAEDLSADELDQKIRDTLEEATPYPLDELAYATQADGPDVQVVAVARQTLDEAQNFATDNGFIPETFSLSTIGGDALTGPAIGLPVEADADPAPEEPAVPIHPIADKPDPEAFRAQDDADHAADAPAEFDLRRFAIPAIAASVILGMAAGAWSLMRTTPDLPVEDTTQAPVVADAPEPQIASLPEPATEPPAEEETLSPTDAAILEALQVEPEQVEDIAPDPEPETVFRDFTGTAPVPPEALPPPASPEQDELYLASIDRSDLSQDPLALPTAESLNTDLPFVLAALPGQAEQDFDLDARGLVTPSPEGTPNPGGVLVFLGPPPKTPPETPARAEPGPEAEVEEVNSRLAGRRPKPRPANLVDLFERSQLGGRSRDELAAIRPKLRPKSIEDRPVVEVVDHTPTALAVVRVPRPKLRPASLVASAAQKPTAGTAALGSAAKVATIEDEAGSFQPKSVAPKIPTTASVARQATIDNAINLRKLNLIGVYGTPANRRALVRLPSGRYKKLKVGDRIDGGNVIAIGDSELRYQKRGKNVTLKMPRG
ncbi:hypothetical protein [Ruegeria sp.]|uniref:hypothetical protein n=1 Tax=Ruegeria sp. TaxID=1879320 RepID=UPI00231C72BF|nr:hypothetical protein [Ruegeria sp.]MDA7966690.1 hypothetical protein [Ruegeria sp.]